MNLVKGVPTAALQFVPGIALKHVVTWKMLERERKVAEKKE
jgi:hypothetical protein